MKRPTETEIEERSNSYSPSTSQQIAWMDGYEACWDEVEKVIEELKAKVSKYERGEK